MRTGCDACKRELDRLKAGICSATPVDLRVAGTQHGSATSQTADDLAELKEFDRDSPVKALADADGLRGRICGWPAARNLGDTPEALDTGAGMRRHSAAIVI